MNEAARNPSGVDDSRLLDLFAAIASGHDLPVRRQIGESPALATRSLARGATREDPQPYFLSAIHHHVYAGDTTLHVAAAAHTLAVARSLTERGADVRARNRRGAEPLHYAADGRPGDLEWNPAAQSRVITYLIQAGADPNATDNSGVAPVHRAVRTRSSKAVEALLRGGADAHHRNRNGSTPLHLAVQNTGKAGSGSDAAINEQRRIIRLLLNYGARPTDVDANGKTVAASATTYWIRRALETP